MHDSSLILSRSIRRDMADIETFYEHWPVIPCIPTAIRRP